MEGEYALGEVNGDGADYSTEQLQESLHALLERHGVMLDLRAYLRTHLIGLVRSAQLGKPSVCKELLSQRLELKTQALNMLIAEYLLRQEFKYTLSVFASEIPLANMVFEFADTLAERVQRQQSTDIRLSEEDVWRVLNSLGVRCDAEHAGKIVDTYRSNPHKPPLLLCLLQSIQLYRDQEDHAVRTPTDVEDLGHRKTENVCDHIVSCELCLASRTMDRENYASKKKHFADDFSEIDSRCRHKVKSDLDQVTAIEEDLINEMFQQLRSVHEEETEVQRERHERRLRRSLAACHQQMQCREQELEEDYQRRRSELEASGEERKRFLWRLARSLRRQHADLAEAVRDVQVEKRQLALREESIREQLKTAEEILKRNGDEMRKQLSQELKVLEQHLDHLKEERETISQERNRLETLKQTIPNQSDEVKTEFEAQKRKNEDLQSHYNNLKEELSTVKHYIATSKFFEPKCLVETSSLTDMCGVNNPLYVTLNHDEMKRNFVDAWVTNTTDTCSAIPKENPLMNNSCVPKMAKIQLINDLTKLKNINFKNDAVVQVNMGMGSLMETAPPPCAAEATAGAPEPPHPLHDHTAHQQHTSTEQEQERIRELVSVQRALRAELESAQRVIDGMTRLAAAATAAAPLAALPTLPTPPTPPPPPPPRPLRWGWGEGSRAPPSRPTPRDHEPFRTFGTLKSKENWRRSSIPSPWSRLRPAGARFRSYAPAIPARARDSHDIRPRLRMFGNGQIIEASACDPRESLTSAHRNSYHEEYQDFLHEESDYRQRKEIQPEVMEHSTIHEEGNVSPTSDMLAAAKKRLRKLEIEADAVEKSYQDFRMRQSADTPSIQMNTMQDMKRDEATDILSRSPLEIHRSKSLIAKSGEYTSADVRSNDSPAKVSVVERKNEFNRYLTDQMRQQEINLSNTMKFSRFNVKAAGNYSENLAVDHDIKSQIKSKGNLIEKPLKEFRKLYQANHKEAPSTHINKALQVLRNNETLLHNKGKEKNIPIHVTKSKSTDHLKDAKDSALQLVNKRPFTANDNTSSKLTESQLDILRNNIRKIYNIEYTPHTNIDEEKISDPKNNTCYLSSRKEEDSIMNKENDKTFTKGKSTMLIKADNLKPQSTSPKCDTLELLYATTKGKEENQKEATNSNFIQNNAMSEKESCDTLIASNTTIIYNNKLESQIPSTFEHESSYRINGIHSGIQTEKMEHKKPTSVLVLVESDMEREKIFLAKDTYAEETLPVSNTMPTNIIKSVNTHGNNEFVDNSINFKQVTSENYSPSNMLSKKNLNVNDDSTKSEIEIMEGSSEHRVRLISENNTIGGNKEKNENKYIMTSNEVTFPIVEVDDLKKTEMIDEIVHNTDPVKDVPDTYSNEGFSNDIDSIGSENNEFDTDASPISVGTSVNDSFWG